MPIPTNYARMFLNPRDNADNLSAEYLQSLQRLPERQRKRFFEGVYIDDLDGALFSYEIIARSRVHEFPPARRTPRRRRGRSVGRRGPRR